MDLDLIVSFQIRLELHKSDRDCQKLQDYANILLQRVGASCPELLDNFVSMMESSDTESCQSTWHLYLTEGAWTDPPDCI